MNEILRGWEIGPTTWVYLSSLMIITVYFKFGRFWSVRNLDLAALLSFGPGLLLAQGMGGEAPFGFLLLFVTSGFFLVRLLIDPQMVRRPLLEPNLSTGGLTFMGAALLVFLMTNVITAPTAAKGTAASNESAGAAPAETVAVVKEKDAPVVPKAPGHPLVQLLPRMPSRAQVQAPEPAPEAQRSDMVLTATARSLAIAGQLAVVIGMMLVGYWHFDNLRTGVAAAALYLLLPYTSQMTGRVDHVLPAAFMVWGVLCFRRPAIAGMLMGVAAGAAFYPLFVLPLWLGFYWQRGFWRFSTGFAVTLALLVASLAWFAPSREIFLAYVRSMFGWYAIVTQDVGGYWDADLAAYRILAMVTYIVLSISLALWPQPKNLGTLLSCSAAVMLGAQFWAPKEGGLFMAWYLPMLLLTVFRPNLEDRIALTSLGDGWLIKLKSYRRHMGRAA